MPEQVDEVANRLYGLPLEEFTRERDAAAKELRKAKERDAAAEVAKLPKPSQAAWAANALSREQRGLVDDLLEAGERLREAQDAAMAGKGAAAMREAGAAERAAVDALVDAAADLEPGGRRPTAATLERLRKTLHAAASDEGVRQALDAGRLVEDATGGGAWGLFGADEGGDEQPAPARRRKSSAAAKPSRASRGDTDTQADRKRDERERKEREAREAAEREARQKLEAELREARAERRSRERELERAEKAAARAADRLEEAREQAEEAGTELESAREAADSARDQVARLEEQLD